mgnify:CR=1 FL=1
MAKLKRGDSVRTAALLFMSERHWNAVGIVLNRKEYGVDYSGFVSRKTNVMVDVYMGDGQVIKLFENEVEKISDG